MNYMVFSLESSVESLESQVRKTQIDEGLITKDF
jgi:hypothetical protein